MSEMNEPEYEGITIMWKIEMDSDVDYASKLKFEWRGHETWRANIFLSKELGRFYLRTKSDNIVARLNGMLFLLDLNGSEWCLGNCDNLHFNNNVKVGCIKLKGLNKLPKLSDNFNHRFIHVRVHLWDKLELFKSELPVIYNVSSSNIDQNCSFNWTLESVIHDNDYRKEFFRLHSMKVPRKFVDYYFMESFNLEISFVCEDFWLDEAVGHYKIHTTQENLQVLVGCRMRVKDNEGNYMQLSESEWTLTGGERDGSFYISPDTLNLLKAKKEEYYPEGKLQVHCDVTTKCILSVIETIEKADIHSTLNMKFLNSVKVCKGSNLNTSMLKLFEDGILCDVVLTVGEKTFHCHKSVICSKSPVFLAMFESDTKENHSGTIDIVDTDADTISLFLSVLYKDVLEVKDLVKIKKLYEVADKYLVTGVVQMCSNFFKEQLSCSNFCEILALADSHQDENVIDFATKYFIQNAKSILKSQEWLDLMRISPTLTGKIMYSLSINALTK